MTSRLYAIVDLETTGLGYKSNKIIDISIFVYDGENILKEFHSIVNPEQEVEYKITKLTGISNKMLQNAPKFYEIARKIIDLTKPCVFVAHNVNFDYKVLQSEYSSLGYHYEREKLCTMRLARKNIPGQPSYSLEQLCKRLNIQNEKRHRARGDARATLTLFKYLRQTENHSPKKTLHKNTTESSPQIDLKDIRQLPNETGVYYFKDNNDTIIYIGKSVNIRQRVLSHFRDPAPKEVKMCHKTTSITYEKTGSELIALLKESQEIKFYSPYFNRAQKRQKELYGLYMKVDDDGVSELRFKQLKMVLQPITTFYSKREARQFLMYLCETYQLCPRYTQLEKTKGRCFHSHIQKCKGVCYGKESVDKYNERVQKAVDSIHRLDKDMLIFEPGRKLQEKAFVLIQNGTYIGYGYLPSDLKKIHAEDVQKHLKRQVDNRDARNIISGYLKSDKNPQTLPFDINSTTI